MKKLLLTLALALVLFSCDDGDDTWTGPIEPNPYPDGVYPFEVSNISHTEEYLSDHRYKYTITWDNPADKGFSRVKCAAFGVTQFGDFPQPDPLEGYWSFVLSKNSLVVTTALDNDQYLIIKCVDRFGNISEGEKCNYRDNYDW